MKSILLSLLVLVSFATLSAQPGTQFAAVTTSPAETASPEAVVQFRLLPQLPGQVSFEDFLSTNVVYPEVAMDNSIEGTVVVAVDVNAAGIVVDRRVVRSAHRLLDAAALRAVANLRHLLPAVENGQAVARTVNLPVRFYLR